MVHTPADSVTLYNGTFLARIKYNMLKFIKTPQLVKWFFSRHSTHLYKQICSSHTRRCTWNKHPTQRTSLFGLKSFCWVSTVKGRKYSPTELTKTNEQHSFICLVRHHDTKRPCVRCPIEGCLLLLYVPWRGSGFARGAKQHLVGSRASSDEVPGRRLGASCIWPDARQSGAKSASPTVQSSHWRPIHHAAQPVTRDAAWSKPAKPSAVRGKESLIDGWQPVCFLLKHKHNAHLTETTSII